MGISWSEEEYQAYLNRQAPQKKKKSKYNAKKTYVDGICFDSQAEANYYSELKLLQRCGLIDGFCRQPRFVVTDGIENKKGTEYVADFIVFYPDGTYKIIDVKGMETPTFKLKMKCFAEKFPRLKVVLEKG